MSLKRASSSSMSLLSLRAQKQMEEDRLAHRQWQQCWPAHGVQIARLRFCRAIAVRVLARWALGAACFVCESRRSKWHWTSNARASPASNAHSCTARVRTKPVWTSPRSAQAPKGRRCARVHTQYLIRTQQSLDCSRPTLGRAPLCAHNTPSRRRWIGSPSPPRASAAERRR